MFWLTHSKPFTPFVEAKAFLPKTHVSNDLESFFFVSHEIKSRSTKSHTVGGELCVCVSKPTKISDLYKKIEAQKYEPEISMDWICTRFQFYTDLRGKSAFSRNLTIQN